MPGRPKSNSEKRQIFVETENKWMDRAVEACRMEQQKLRGKKRLGLCGVCKLMEEECWKEDKASRVDKTQAREIGESNSTDKKT